jgi:predicted  nucleic acid-binding Zn-ribbon protein
LKDQLKLLEELQRHDARIQELEGARKAIPAKLEAMKGDLEKVEAMLARERAELAETEKWRRDKEGEMKSEEAQLSKAKAKLGQVKTSKEYMATQREVETNRKMAAETEGMLLEVMQASEAAKGKISVHEQDVEKLRQVVAKEEVEAQEKLSRIDGEIAAARGGREAAAKAVRPDVLKKYGAIRMRRGLAVVPVHNGTCRGCNMNIPPQLFNTLQRGSSIELCPNCNRIIYWDKIMEDPDGKPSA